MSTSGVTVGSNASSPLTITGLASGLDTSAIISALMGAERAPVTRLTQEETKFQAQDKALQNIQSSLQQLSFAASEFILPSLFESSQTVSSSEPTRVSAATSAGAAIGGHEVEVTKLANSAQRTFTFTSPTSEDKVTIDGQEFTLKANGTAKELASAINSHSGATVYAAVLEDGTIVLSNRATGSGAEFIKVSDTAGALTEKAESAKAGQDAEYTIDGVAGTSASNILTNAIPGVTLTLTGITTTGPVTIDVQPPGVSATAVEAQVQAFIKTYNTAVAAIQKELTTKPPTSASSTEVGNGTLFGDVELNGLLSNLRLTMYEPIAGLPAEMASPSDIGITTGAPSSGGASQSSIEGLLTVNTTKLAEAVKANPEGVQKMLAQWSQNLQTQLRDVAEPGGTIEARVSGNSAQVTQLTSQISTMNELLLVREKALQETYAKLEGVISQNSSQATWLSSQASSLTSQGL